MRLLSIPVLLLMLNLSSLAAGPVQVHGHRGARAAMPENTLPAFEYAIGEGVDVLELDLSVTKDNVLVASHDPVLPEAICAGPGGTRVIREMTFDELRRWDCGATRNAEFPRQKTVPGTHVPSLDEVLALAPRGGFGFNIETKIHADQPQYTPEPEEFARLLVEAIRKHKLEKRTIIQSFDFRTLRAAKKLAPEIPRAALYSGRPVNLVDLTRQADATMLSPHWRLVTPEVVKQAQDAGFPVVPWTANEPEQWEKLTAAGVDAIITDDPAGLIAWLKARGLR
jgi:glycerophosphoryl diester phosphodiesterase